MASFTSIRSIFTGSPAVNSANRRASSGRVFTPENAAELIELLVSQSATRTQVLEHPLYRSWWTLGLFLALYDWDWPAAEVEFRRAVELNQGSGTIHLYYGICLITAGRFRLSETYRGVEALSHQIA